MWSKSGPCSFQKIRLASVVRATGWFASRRSSNEGKGAVGEDVEAVDIVVRMVELQYEKRTEKSQ